MSAAVLITLVTAGADTGPFDIYIDVDCYRNPASENVSRDELMAGYALVGVPDSTTRVRVQSKGTCTNSVDFVIAPAVP